jgi:hypothetical protein
MTTPQLVSLTLSSIGSIVSYLLYSDANKIYSTLLQTHLLTFEQIVECIKTNTLPKCIAVEGIVCSSQSFHSKYGNTMGVMSDLIERQHSSVWQSSIDGRNGQW